MLIVIVTVCVVGIIALIGLWPKDKNNVSTSNETKVLTSANNADNADDANEVDNANNPNTEPVVTYDIDIEKMTQINTPYCKLNYQKEWADNLKCEEKEENGIYSQTFYCRIKKQEIEMFTVYFGETPAGVQLGYVIKDGKKVPFRVDINTVEPDSSWTKKEKALLDDMTKGVNDVIISVVSSENYSKQ